jgi:hypothetical protein
MAFLAHDRNRGALLPIDAGGVPAKSGRPALMVSGGVDGEEVSDWWRQREGLTRRLVHGGGDRRQGKDVGKPEQGSPAGSKQLGRKYLTVRCLGWGRGSRRGAGAVYPRWLSDDEHDGAVAVKRAEEEGKGGCSTVGCSFYRR